MNNTSLCSCRCPFQGKQHHYWCEQNHWMLDVMTGAGGCVMVYLLTVCVQEHRAEKGGGSLVLSECEDLKQEQSRISRLERQAQEFLNAVFHRKGTHTCTDVWTLTQMFEHFNLSIEDIWWIFLQNSSTQQTFNKKWAIRIVGLLLISTAEQKTVVFLWNITVITSSIFSICQARPYS